MPRLTPSDLHRLRPGAAALGGEAGVRRGGGAGRLHRRAALGAAPGDQRQCGRGALD